MPPANAGSGSVALRPDTTGRATIGDRTGRLDRPGIMLTPLEIRVLTLARGDGHSSLRSAGWLTRYLVGTQAPLPLANARLEALRRYAVTVRLNGAAEQDPLVDAGYAPALIDEITSHILRAP